MRTPDPDFCTVLLFLMFAVWVLAIWAIAAATITTGVSP